MHCESAGRWSMPQQDDRSTVLRANTSAPADLLRLTADDDDDDDGGGCDDAASDAADVSKCQSVERTAQNVISE